MGPSNHLAASSLRGDEKRFFSKKTGEEPMLKDHHSDPAI
jgi:hypothetical protein